MAHVTTVTSLGRSGLQDWIIQRISAVVLGAYFGFIILYAGIQKPLDYENWLLLFASPVMQFFTVVALISLMIHAWIGFWTVSTDYLKPISIRLSIQILMMLFLFANLFWGFSILWGI